MKKWFVKKTVITERWVHVEAETRDKAKAFAESRILRGECNSNRDTIKVSATVVNY